MGFGRGGKGGQILGFCIVALTTLADSGGRRGKCATPCKKEGNCPQGGNVRGEYVQENVRIPFGYVSEVGESAYVVEIMRSQRYRVSLRCLIT